MAAMGLLSLRKTNIRRFVSFSSSFLLVLVILVAKKVDDE